MQVVAHPQNGSHLIRRHQVQGTPSTPPHQTRWQPYAHHPTTNTKSQKSPPDPKNPSSDNNPDHRRTYSHNTTHSQKSPSPTTTRPLSREPSPSPSQGEIKRGSQGEGNRATKGRPPPKQPPPPSPQYPRLKHPIIHIISNHSHHSSNAQHLHCNTPKTQQPSPLSLGGRGLG